MSKNRSRTCTLLKSLQKLLNDSDLKYLESLQALWSGYGEITRYHSPKLSSTVIVKSVNPPTQIDHPRGWHSSISHKRKLASYKIEAYFYQNYADLCSQSCYVPQLIAFSQCPKNSEAQILIMQDLQQLGYKDIKGKLSLANIKNVISWLASFHAKFIDHKADGLWPTGSYWHLSTRQDEYKNMAESLLKKKATEINQRLNKAHYQTIVHGDAKQANFGFIEQKDRQKSSVAAVDFQYVGKGVGVKDLAYFLGSCLNSEELIIHHDEMLDYYFQTLVIACKHYKHAINTVQLEQEWRELYCFANADFHRFLLGWSPEHPKINRYLQKQTDIALKQLDTQ